MKISKKEIIWIVAFIFVVTGIVYWAYYLSPAIDEMEQIELSINQKQIKILSMQNAIGQIDTIKNEIAVLEAEIEKQSEDIPKGVSLPLQLVEMTNVFNGKCSDLVISFEQSTATYDDYQKNSAHLSFQTSYEQLLAILNEFEELGMANQIVKMNLAYTSDILSYYTAVLEGYYLVVNTTVEFYSFYAPSDAEPLEKQPFEDSPVVDKNPFKPTAD